MSRSLFTIFLVSWSMLSAHAVAQVRHDLPGLNRVGQFFGVGYTLGGYHAGARDGSPATRFSASHTPVFELHRMGPQWKVAPCQTCQPAGSQPLRPVDLFHSSPQPTEAQPAEEIRLDASPTAFHYDLSPAPASGLDAAHSLDTAHSKVIASAHLSTPLKSTVDSASPPTAGKNLYQQAFAPPAWRARY